MENSDRTLQENEDQEALKIWKSKKRYRDSSPEKSADIQSASPANNNQRVAGQEVITDNDSAGKQRTIQTNFNQNKGNNQVNNFNPKRHFYYKKGVPPAGPDMENILNCMGNDLGRDLGISGGSECKAPHKLSTTRGHCAGKAADISYRMNPNIDPQKVMLSAEKCGAKYGKIEKNHYHVQTHLGRGGTSGALPGSRYDDYK